MIYRSDIDGLRAVAVLSVILFHLMAGMTGGYVGVDIFFVISGFLISKQIYTGLSDGSFTLADFYERRARRILPALLFILLITSAVGAVTFYPSELVSYARSVAASILFVPNVYFHNINYYFGPMADTLPLLHLWSLGIEEQFYIVFPLLLIMLARLAPKSTLPLWPDCLASLYSLPTLCSALTPAPHFI